ncbi:MAG TPA: DUF1016 N-terminal domain-containing protein [Candidatus Omnitrophota bacterium]|nr:DUF1016 N-terminal domain-containing protein [Candidatus Omnitrophota bacterium]HSA30753.1 DUF1016 N-terminal domain-containing protein [Candidatus Omnitrophota bacterium]
MPKPPATKRFQKLVDDISRLYLNAREAQVKFAWETGRRIVQEEQDGELRAEYGTGLIPELSKVLVKEHGAGFSETNLRRMRKFFLSNQKQSAPTELAWTDYVELMPVRDGKIRKQLEARIVKEGLKSREIRQEVRRLCLERGEIEDAQKKVPDTFFSTHDTGHTTQVIQKPLTPLKIPSDLVLQTYSRSTLDVSLNDGEVLLDCGFFVHWPVNKDVLKTLNVTDTPSYTYAATLERVVDADTLAALIHLGFGIIVREKLRLRGINAPEVGTPAGDRAKSQVSRLLPAGTPLIIKSHKSKTDTYGRFVADVFFGPQALETSDINAILESPVYLNQYLLDQGMAERVDY